MKLVNKAAKERNIVASAKPLPISTCPNFSATRQCARPTVNDALLWLYMLSGSRPSHLPELVFGGQMVYSHLRKLGWS